MQAYTIDGIAYKVDTRLRPDGSKGPLVNNIKGYRNYYLHHADNWEVQALIKARPVSASREGSCAFMDMREEVFRKRAGDVKKEDILHMRKRIMTELKKPAGGIDIKLDSGGVEEIEFVVQYLQLRNADKLAVFYQDTVNALRSLFSIGRLTEGDMSKLTSSYILFRTIESYLRLSMKSTIKEDDTVIDYVSEFMGQTGTGEFLAVLADSMAKVASTADKMYKQ